MKRIHIVEPYQSVAMNHMYSPLTELAKLYEVTTGAEMDLAADCNIHFPWHTLAGQEKGESKHIIVYTHVNPPDMPALLDACNRADLIVPMSFEGRRELVSFGVDPKKLWVNYAAANEFKFRRRLIAIVGYPQPNGRKREHLLIDMAWLYDLNMYEFLFTGAGWENVVEQLKSLGVPVQSVTAKDWQAINNIYHHSDALLVTGYTEGGPLPVLEAMASGTKIFSPRFGYSADLLEEEDLYDSLPELMEKMGAYFERSVNNHMLARAWTWKDYTNEYTMLIGRLLGESVDLYPERGTSRYAQLLDVIDDIEPASIVEIGTWSGNRAIQMIQQAAKYKPIEDIEYQGFDLFGSQTAADLRRELSKGGWLKHIVQKRLDATGANIYLVEGYTRDTLHKMEPANLFFIDGGHSEETIQYDAESVFLRLRTGDVAVFDDYYFDGKPEGMGCNKVIDSLDREKYVVTFLPATTATNDGRAIKMVRVERRKENNATIRLQMPQTTYAGSVYDLRAGVGGTQN